MRVPVRVRMILGRCGDDVGQHQSEFAKCPGGNLQISCFSGAQNV